MSSLKRRRGEGGGESDLSSEDALGGEHERELELRDMGEEEEEPEEDEDLRRLALRLCPREGERCRPLRWDRRLGVEPNERTGDEALDPRDEEGRGDALGPLSMGLDRGREICRDLSPSLFMNPPLRLASPPDFLWPPLLHASPEFPLSQNGQSLRITSQRP